MFAMYSYCRNLFPLGADRGRAGRGPLLFENLPDHNPPRELKREELFLNFIAPSPLKRLDSEK
jgi:hypothetical protein